MIIMEGHERFLYYDMLTAIAPPQEGERVGVSTSIYYRV
jgi:hypothetical protein